MIPVLTSLTVLGRREGHRFALEPGHSHSRPPLGPVLKKSDNDGLYDLQEQLLSVLVHINHPLGYRHGLIRSKGGGKRHCCVVQILMGSTALRSLIVVLQRGLLAAGRVEVV